MHSNNKTVRFVPALTAALLFAATGACMEPDELGSASAEARRGSYGSFWGVIFQNGIRFEGTARVTPSLSFPGNLDISERLDGNLMTFGIHETMIFLAPTEISLDTALDNPAVADLVVRNPWYRAFVEWLVYVTGAPGTVFERALTASDNTSAVVRGLGVLNVAPNYTQGQPMTESQVRRTTPFTYTKFNPTNKVCVMATASFLSGQDLDHLEFSWGGVVAGRADGLGITHYVPYAAAADPASNEPPGDEPADLTDTSYYQLAWQGKAANGVDTSEGCTYGAASQGGMPGGEGANRGDCFDFDAYAGGYRRVNLYGDTVDDGVVSLGINDSGIGCSQSCDINSDCDPNLGESCIDGTCI